MKGRMMRSCTKIPAVAFMALIVIGYGSASAAGDGAVDADALKLTTQETRLNRLAVTINDIGVHLPPEKAFKFTNDNDLHDLRARVKRGQAKREDLLKKGPPLLKE